jgi:hypothetical protein
MTLFEGLEFVETIEPTTENAKAIVSLVRQDAKAGHMTELCEYANPEDPDIIEEQLSKMIKDPKSYCGYTKDGQLVAFIRQLELLNGSVLPYAVGGDWIVLMVKKLLRLSPRTGQLFISGLVASEELEPEERVHALRQLLQKSFTGERKNKVVNIVLHDSDPLLDIAPKLGFDQFGKRGEDPAIPGVKQRMFRRPVAN